MSPKTWFSIYIVLLVFLRKEGAPVNQLEQMP